MFSFVNDHNSTTGPAPLQIGRGAARPSSVTGFTMIQLLVGISIFTIVMAVSMGAILSALDANRKAQAMQTAMNSLNYGLESMVRHIRFGTDYRCGSGDCPNGAGSMVVNFKGVNMRYRVHNGRLERLEETSPGSGSYAQKPITGPDIEIEDLQFYVTGSGDTDGRQPKAIITLRGIVAEGRDYETEFDLQTTVSQRAPDR